MRRAGVRLNWRAADALQATLEFGADSAETADRGGAYSGGGIFQRSDEGLADLLCPSAEFLLRACLASECSKRFRGAAAYCDIGVIGRCLGEDRHGHLEVPANLAERFAGPRARTGILIVFHSMGQGLRLAMAARSDPSKRLGGPTAHLGVRIGQCSDEGLRGTLVPGADSSKRGGCRRAHRRVGTF